MQNTMQTLYTYLPKPGDGIDDLMLILIITLSVLGLAVWAAGRLSAYLFDRQIGIIIGPDDPEKKRAFVRRTGRDLNKQMRWVRRRVGRTHSFTFAGKRWHLPRLQPFMGLAHKDISVRAVPGRNDIVHILVNDMIFEITQRGELRS